MPKYQIQDEAFENQSIARSRAFGRDRSIQAQESQLDQDASDAISRALDTTSSTSDLLATISAINANTASARRGLGAQEADIQAQNTRDLYQVNSQMIDEQDKAWRQNVYAPWDARLRALKERKANRDAFWSNMASGLLSAAGTVAGAAIAGPAGAAAGSQAGRLIPRRRPTFQEEMNPQDPFSEYGL